MKELEYPFNAEEIIAKKKKIRKSLLAAGTDWLEKRIAILGGFTTNGIKQVLELFLLNHGIKPAFYESEYNQYYQDAMFPNAELESFAPDIIYICTCNRNITTYPELSDSPEDIENLLQAETARFTGMWDRLRDVYHCEVIQNNFELPHYRLLGNRDAADIHGAVNYVTRLNMEFYSYAQQHEHFYICDLNYISADYGLKAWADPFYWHMYKYAVAVPAIPYLAFNVANIVKSILGKNKKGFVLDLDNTLWGGVIGEDGADNIELGPEESTGQAYSEFQRYLKAHQQLGVVLNVASKNDYENAAAGLNHPDSIFSEDDFICIKANWKPKDSNVAEIAKELNLLPESLVFVDDNPSERHIVTERYPGVAAPELSDVAHYIELIDRAGFFEATNLSKDDLKRNSMYQANAARAKVEKSFTDYGEYLKSLDMHAAIKPFEPVYMARIAQLTNKTNQFNLTTKRYTQAEIEEVAGNPDYITLYGRLTDRFGDNGVVSVVIGRVDNEAGQIGKTCHIELWLMSCRVLKRDMELAIMDAFVEQCIKNGINEIRGYYYPTAKNKMTADFYQTQGFQKISDEDGSVIWKLDIRNGYKEKNRYITVEEYT